MSDLLGGRGATPDAQRAVLARKREVQAREQTLRDEIQAANDAAASGLRDRDSGKAPCSNCSRSQHCSHGGNCYDAYGYSLHTHYCFLCFREWQQEARSARQGRR